MQRVLVLDKNKKALMPCYPSRASELLRKGNAVVYRKFPFTILLKYREGGAVQETELKLDPGSKTTGIAVVAKFKRGRTVIWASNLIHRGHTIRHSLESRRAVRRGRRSRKTRYRQARFLNRTRHTGGLPPSLMSRVFNVATWAKRLFGFFPISSIAVETVRFDFQKMVNPEITGVEYQQGTLEGYEVREYLLEKFKRACVYCKGKEIPLQIEHIIPKARGGTNRVSNLTLSCEKCNSKKGTLTAEEFGHSEVQAKAEAPLKDASAVNATRYKIGEVLKAFGLPFDKLRVAPVSFWSGGRTKFNRCSQGYDKDHWIDAACVGETGKCVIVPKKLISIEITAMGSGNRQMCLMDRYGFPRTKPKKLKRVHGFQTGDIVKAVVASGKKKGSYFGRVAIRESGSFNIKTKTATVEGISWKHCRKLQSADGYAYF